MSGDTQSDILTPISTALQSDLLMGKGKVGHRDWERPAGEPASLQKEDAVHILFLPDQPPACGLKPTGKHHSLQKQLCIHRRVCKWSCNAQDV